MTTTTHTAGAPEFPGYVNVREGDGVAEFADADPAAAALNRRSFLALSAAALGAATLAGCRRPDIEILPFSAVPDEQIGHSTSGKPTFYATSIPRAGGALPVLVESHDGRPTKIEGNPQHPASGGATDAFAQATVFDLYSPDRVMSDKYPGVMERGAPRRWADFDRAARTLIKPQGEGFYVLTDQTPSPALRLIREHIKTALPKASWHTFEPVDQTEALAGAEIAFGSKLVAKYDFAKIDRILALDSDFLGTDADAVENGREFAKRRKIEKPRDKMNRLYVVESTYTVTGTMADHRLRLPASQIGAFLLAVVRELKATHAANLHHATTLPNLPEPGTTFPEKWVKAVAKDLAEHRLKSVILVGHRQPAWVHALAHVVNEALFASSLISYVPAFPEQTGKGIGELTRDMAAGKVATLLIVGGNPALNAPADADFKNALQKVGTRIRLGLFHDQTSELCDWHLPMAHPLESWGDTETSDGSLCCVQPLIAPLNGNRSPGTADTEPPARGGRTALEVLALMTAFPNPADGKATGSFFAAQKAAYAAVRKVFSQRSGIQSADKAFDTEFNRYKQLGFVKGDPQLQHIANSVQIGTAVARYRPTPAPTKDALEVTFHPDATLLDGRFAMNPWLQEMPDPITKLVWDNAAVISPKTAAEFKVATGDRVKLTIGGVALDIPVFILPGQADYSVALAYGQSGEMRIAHVPDGGGTDVFPARKLGAMHTVTNCRLEKTGKTADLVMTQEHGVIPEGRNIIGEHTAANYAAHLTRDPHEHRLPGEDRDPKIGIAPGQHVTPEDFKHEFQGGYGNPQQFKAPAREKQERFPLDLARPELLDAQFQWGMTIDLNACTGCTACLIACQAENNIPVVGKAEVKRNRELHWIRIDRYFSSDGHTADADPRIVTQPVACVHCEAAPCEQVCPVNAAVHSTEGLNLQVYNRCIGTRYCANACPYKVRRFNWFDFNKRKLDELRTPTPFAEGGASFTENLLPETLKMQKNPDVTVRMRGVMEKCTYCIQRIERGKYGAKIAATEVAQGRRVIDADPSFKHEGPPTAYRKPKNPRAAGYDLDALGRVIVPDGLIVTACESACPTRAITFGNVLDPNSAVYKAKERAGEYLPLGELNTKPRTSYLPRLRNPNPELA
ncbi:4Fe-4S dicluster domain-containing protein [Gemmata sp.]|uniref:4Fe-4S dicluster domain-containing protein n=1 Tax=Gemmata sp. TaxID=1914242 RepID=UPI003F72FA6D